MEPLHKPDHPDQQNDDGQNPCDVERKQTREVEAASGVRFRQEVLKPPAATARTEQRDQQCAKRKEIVTHDKVFQVKHAGSLAQRLETLPEIETEDAGKREDEEQDSRQNC